MKHPAELIGELRQRRAVQFVLAYLVGAWVGAQVVGFFVEQGYVGRVVLDVTLFLLGVGLFATLVIVWYHGEEGRQSTPPLGRALLAVLGLVALVGSGWVATRSGDSGGVASEMAPVVELGDSSVAVLPFQNDLADQSLAWLDRGVSELLATDLAQLAWLRVVSGQRIFDLMRQMGEGESRVIPEALQGAVTRMAGARYMLTGRLVGANDEIVLIASLQDARTGEIRAATRHQGDDIFALVDRVSADLLRDGLVVEGAPLTAVAELTTGSLDAFAEYRRGVEARDRFLADESLRHFQAAVELDPTFALAHLQLAGLHTTTGAFDLAMRSLSLAEQHLGSASGRDQMYVRGLTRLIRGDMDGGIGTLEALISEYPDEKEVRILLANFHRTLGRTSLAERLMRETLRLDPFYGPGYNELAYAMARRDDFDSALVLIDRYAEVEPGQPNPFDSRGEILEMAGRHAEAREAYRSALELRNDFTAAVLHLARSYMREERADDGRAELERYTTLPAAGTRITAHRLIGDLFMFDGQFDEGYAAYQRAIDEARAVAQEGREQSVWRAWMFTAIQIGHLDEAEFAADRLGQITPDPMIRVVRAIAEGEQGRANAVSTAADGFEADFRNDPQMAPFFGMVLGMYRVNEAFYRGEHERVVALALAAPLAVPGAGTDYLGFPVMKSLLALERAEESRRQVGIARGAGVTGIPGRYEPVQERLLSYYEGRAAELAGDAEAAIAAYETLVSGWGEVVREVPAVADVADRLDRLRG